jgi:hypothetical protein
VPFRAGGLKPRRAEHGRKLWFTRQTSTFNLFHKKQICPEIARTSAIGALFARLILKSYGFAGYPAVQGFFFGQNPTRKFG